jgi:hypothetical protein
VLKPIDGIRNVTMTTTVEMNQNKSRICLDVTYFFKSNAINRSITVQIKSLSKQAGTHENPIYLEKNAEPHWVKKRNEIGQLGAGKYNISINIVPYAVFIADIHFCQNRESDMINKNIFIAINIFLILATLYVTPVYNYLADCKFLDRKDATSVLNDDHGLWREKTFTFVDLTIQIF